MICIGYALMFPAAAHAEPAQSQQAASTEQDWQAALQLFASGHYAASLDKVDTVYEARQHQLGNVNALTVAALAKKSEVLVKLGRAREAVPLAEAVVQAFNQLNGPKHEDTLAARNALAYVLFYAGNSARAYDEQIAVNVITQTELGPLHRITLTGLSQQAEFYGDLGHWAEELELQRKTVNAMISTLGEGDLQTLLALQRLAVAHSKFGQLDDTLIYYQRVLRGYTSILGAQHPDTLKILGLVGYTKFQQNKTAEANIDLKAAYTGLRDTVGEHHINTLGILSLLGQVELDLGHNDQGLDDLRRAYEGRLALLGPKDPRTLSILSYYSYGTIRIKGAKAAIPLYEKLVSVSRDTYGENSHQVLCALSNLSYAYAQTGEQAKAIQSADQTVAKIEQLRSNDITPENRRAIFSCWVPVYKEIARIDLQYGQPEKTLYMAELSKARTLLELLAARESDHGGIISADEQAQLSAYQDKLAQIDNQKLAVSRGSSEAMQLDAERSLILHGQEQFRQKLYVKYPKYERLSNVKFISSEEGTALLDEDTAFISFLNAGLPVINVPEHTLALILTRREGLKVIDLGEITNLGSSISAYVQMLGTIRPHRTPRAWRMPDGSFSWSIIKPDPAAIALTSAKPIAAKLSERLLRPLTAILAKKRHWIISPDGPLALLPFETLPIKGEMAILRHDINYVQSLSVYALLKKRAEELDASHDRDDLFAMGASVYQPEVPNDTLFHTPLPVMLAREETRGNEELPPALMGSQRTYAMLNLNWANLPASAREVEVVASQFEAARTRVYEHGDASEDRLQALNAEHVLSQYRYLLFAAHGYLDTDEPNLSALVLNQVGTTPEADGYVTAAEWPAYDLRSDLIVLSSCKTGLGSNIQGEGIMGLPFAMFVAGNRNALLSLWSVSDYGSAEFMKSLFTRLRKGMSQVHAVAETKRQFIQDKKYSNPMFWAAYILYGN